MKDVEIARLLDMPLRNLQNWKKSNDWRRTIYKFFSLKDKVEIEEEILRIKNICALEIEKEKINLE